MLLIAQALNSCVVGDRKPDRHWFYCRKPSRTRDKGWYREEWRALSPCAELRNQRENSDHGFILFLWRQCRKRRGGLTCDWARCCLIFSLLLKCQQRITIRICQTHCYIMLATWIPVKIRRFLTIMTRPLGWRTDSLYRWRLGPLLRFWAS